MVNVVNMLSRNWIKTVEKYQFLDGNGKCLEYSCNVSFWHFIKYRYISKYRILNEIISLGFDSSFKVFARIKCLPSYTTILWYNWSLSPILLTSFRISRILTHLIFIIKMYSQSIECTDESEMRSGKNS